MTQAERALLIAVAETVHRMASNPVAMVSTAELSAALKAIDGDEYAHGWRALFGLPPLAIPTRSHA